MSAVSRPLWLDHPGVRQLLGVLVDRLDRAQASGTEAQRRFRLNARNWPALFKAELEADKELLWGYLLQMRDWGWVEVSTERLMPGMAPYEAAPSVRIADAAALRVATGRSERPKSRIELWREAIEATFPADVHTLFARQPIEVPGHAPSEVAERLAGIVSLADSPLLLREVSSRLFWGDSKVLDGRQTLVARILGLDECPFPEAPVQLQVFLPAAGEAARGVLFIENQVTFELATRSSEPRFAHLALAFASGFRGSAQRLRTPGGVSLYFGEHGSLQPAAVAAFKGWLFGTGTANPAWFWGDLDYAGMRILAALARSFPGMTAWRPGYEPLAQALAAGGGHLPEMAGKAAQKPIDGTGCAWADAELIPLLARTGRFIDQEADLRPPAAT